MALGEFNDTDFQNARSRQCVDGQADPVHRDRAVRNEELIQLRRYVDPDEQGRPVSLYKAHTTVRVHVTLHDVATEPVGDLHVTLQVHALSLPPVTDGGALEHGRDRGHGE